MKAVYLLNRLPTRSLDGKTPHEAWYNKKPAVHHLRVFGCVAYMKVTHPHLAKVNPRRLKVVFIGYEPGIKVYRLYDLAGGRAHMLCDVVFDKNTFWGWNNVTEANKNSNQFIGGVPRHRAGRRRSATSGTVTATSSCTRHAYTNTDCNSC